MQEYQFLTYSESERIGYITLNRPEKRNALNDILIIELKDAFRRAEHSSEVKVIVLRANGDAFCAGADLEYLQRMQEFTLEQNMADSTALAELYLGIYRLSKVVIAEVAGPAIAGGCGLVTVCDFAFSTPESKFGYSEVKIGFVPAIVMTFLLRKVGETRAKELMLSGIIVDGATAARYDLINEVYPADSLSLEVEKFAQMLCEKNALGSMSLTKKMIADIQEFPLDAAISFASRMNARARGSEECKKGIAAFLDKTPLSW